MRIAGNSSSALTSRRSVLPSMCVHFWSCIHQVVATVPFIVVLLVVCSPCLPLGMIQLNMSCSQYAINEMECTELRACCIQQRSHMRHHVLTGKSCGLNTAHTHFTFSHFSLSEAFWGRSICGGLQSILATARFRAAGHRAAALVHGQLPAPAGEGPLGWPGSPS